MIIFFLIPLIIAKIKKIPIKNAFTHIDLYPVFFVEILHLFCQITFYLGITYFAKYASLLQILFIVSLIVPILHQKLYTQGIIGSLLTVLGTILNKIVINANGGKMPVYGTISKLTGYMKPGMLGSDFDPLHTAMTDATRLNFLGDYIDLGFCILSPGDVLIHAFISLIIFYSLKQRKNRTN